MTDGAISVSVFVADDAPPPQIYTNSIGVSVHLGKWPAEASVYMTVKQLAELHAVIGNYLVLETGARQYLAEQEPAARSTAYLPQIDGGVKCE